MKQKLKQLILKYTNEIIAIIILIGIVIGVTIIYNNNDKVVTIDNDSTSCQKVIEDSIIKDQLIEAYQAKDKMVTKLLDNNDKMISKYEQMIINLEIMVKDQERIIELKEQQIKLLGGDI